jgi:hypothetical protein
MMPVRRKQVSVQAFEAAMRRIAEENDCSIGSLQRRESEFGDLTDDDCTASYGVVGKAAQSLKTRFLQRIAETYCGHKDWNLGAMAMMKEQAQLNSVEIWIVPFEPSTGEDSRVVPDMLSQMAESISRLNRPSKSHSKPSFIPNTRI